MLRRIFKNKPVGRRGDAIAERFMVTEGALDAVVIEDHPGIKGQRNLEDRSHAAHLGIQGIGIAAVVVGKDVHFNRLICRGNAYNSAK